MNKLKEFLEQLKSKFDEKYPGGEVSVKKLSDDPFGQAEKYMVSMMSNGAVSHHILMYDPNSESADFIRVFIR